MAKGNPHRREFSEQDLRACAAGGMHPSTMASRYGVTVEWIEAKREELGLKKPRAKGNV